MNQTPQKVEDLEELAGSNLEPAWRRLAEEPMEMSEEVVEPLPYLQEGQNEKGPRVT